MTAPIDFYFDFSSPYAYLTSGKIDALAARHGREVKWRPFLLGAVFKLNGSTAPVNVPIKADYYWHDFPRTARLFGMPYKRPPRFPINSVGPARAFYWLDTKDPVRAKELAHALFRAYYVEEIDVSDTEAMIQVCARAGIASEEVRAGIADAQVKERTRTEVDAAIARGVFGSPYIMIDGEPFWGSDRLDQVERWLATGGW